MSAWREVQSHLKHHLVWWLLLPAMGLAALGMRRSRRQRQGPPRLLWGTTPLANWKYWSAAMKAAGYPSTTWVTNLNAILAPDDFDEVVDVRAGAAAFVRRFTGLYRAARDHDVVFFPYNGFLLGSTPLWRWEAWFFKTAGVKMVIAPFGGDMWRYSQVQDPSLRHVLLWNYPQMAGQEAKLRARMAHWDLWADAVLSTSIVDGQARWDALAFNTLVLDLDEWQPPAERPQPDGVDGEVVVVHAPNHRGFKGTEFVQDAVRQLQAKGLKVRLLLLEGVPNQEVRRLMHSEAHILAESFIFNGYALNGIEGMALGLPVMCNLDDGPRTTFFRRYTYLGECPVVSATPEDLVVQLEALVRKPALRLELGRLGRRYVEKYHSYPAAQALFGALLNRLMGLPGPDPMSIFHPLLSPLHASEGPLSVPLTRNKIEWGAVGTLGGWPGGDAGPSGPPSGPGANIARDLG